MVPSGYRLKGRGFLTWKPSTPARMCRRNHPVKVRASQISGYPATRERWGCQARLSARATHSASIQLPLKVRFRHRRAAPSPEGARCARCSDNGLWDRPREAHRTGGRGKVHNAVNKTLKVDIFRNALKETPPHRLAGLNVLLPAGDQVVNNAYAVSQGQKFLADVAS